MLLRRRFNAIKRIAFPICWKWQSVNLNKRFLILVKPMSIIGGIPMASESEDFRVNPYSMNREENAISVIR